MVKPVLHQVAKFSSVQQIAVGNVLDDIMSDTQKNHICDKSARTQGSRTRESQSRPLHGDHRGEKHKNLIRENAREELAIRFSAYVAGFGIAQPAFPIAEFETETNSVKDDHMD